MKSFIAACFVLLVGATAHADSSKAKKSTDEYGFGMCMGISTRCDLLPKGICFMQAGCFNPMYGDRCGGTAKQCTGFNAKNACMMQRGCTWVKQKTKSKEETKDQKDPEEQTQPSSDLT
jgi:hypothetical protein